jgi:hypothetical protein
MTTFNTGNPIGSTDARDRSDNSENLDLAVNSLSQTFVDRLGRTRDTLEGIYQKSAYYRAGTFGAGYTLTNNRQTLAYGNVEYSWSGSFGENGKQVPPSSTPSTSGGVGVGAWVDRTQDSLRTELSGGGSLAMPYAVINVDLPPYNGDLGSAIDSAPAGSTLLLGNRDYNIVGKFRFDTVAFPAGNWSGIEKKNIKIVGSGMPELSSDESRFISGSGTVIQGALINFADGFECWNLGVDVGDYVVDTLASGVHMEGFVPGTHKLNTTWSDPSTAYINDIHFGNIKILLKQPVAGDRSTEKHCCLIERIDGGSHGYVECIGGTHGFVMKSRNIVPNGSVRAWRQTTDTAIFKTDTFSECSNYIGGNLVVGSKGHAIRSGQIQFQAANNTRFQNVKMDVKGVNWGGLSRVYDGATTPLEYVTIGNFMSDDANSTSITIPSIAVNWKIGNHTISFGPYGLASESGCVGCHIGNGSVVSCTGDGYRLAGDVQHSNLYAKANGGYGVYNNGAIINPELISGVSNTNGLLSGLFGAGGLITRTNSWADDGNGWYQPVLFGNKIKLSGQVKFGTADLFASITDGFRPKVSKTFTTTAYNGSAYVSLPVNILTSGNITIIGGASVVSSGGWIMLDGIEWSYI